MNQLFWAHRVIELKKLGPSRVSRHLGENSPTEKSLETLALFSRGADASVVLLLIAAFVGMMVHPACAQSMQASAPPEDIHDIQGIISLAGLQWWIYAGGLVALAGILLVIYLLKRKKPQAVQVESAEAVAFRELDEARQLMREGMAREFSLDVSEILRRYIEDRFNIPVVQRTTEEFLQDMRKSGLVGLVSHLDELDLFLKLCDQAKFGREPLTLDEMDTMWASARNFVDQTGLSIALGQSSRSNKIPDADPSPV